MHDVIGLPGMTPELAYGLNLLEDATGVPADSAAAVMYAESGLKPDAANRLGKKTGPIVAAGLIQLTRGANLPGFTTQADIDRVAAMSVIDQIQQVVIPYYRRFGSGAKGASPGHLRMMNFLPALANQPDGTVLATLDGENNAIYRANYGFDVGAKPDGHGGFTGGKGFFTIADVYANTEGILGRAHSRVQPSPPSSQATPTQAAQPSTKAPTEPSATEPAVVDGGDIDRPAWLPSWVPRRRTLLIGAGVTVAGIAAALYSTKRHEVKP